MDGKKKLVVLGSGMAGGKLIEEVLSCDPDRYQITVIGDEPYGNYNRIKLVVKLKEPDLPDFFLNTPEWYASHGIEAILGTAAKEIDRKEKTVILDDGRSVGYDCLVLAVGGKPFIPAVKGLELPGVFALRQLDDVEKTQDYLRDKSLVTVVGGGVLGLELALMLRLLGKRVTVSHLMPSLMEMQLPPEAGSYLQRHLEHLGIHTVLGTYITELLGTTAGIEHVLCRNGMTFEADAVFFSCGIRPNADLARACGLVCNKGVAVNEFLQTSDPSIYACGECLEFRGETWGLVAPIYRQAQVLAEVLCGEQTPYIPGSPSPLRLKSDIPVISMGRFEPEPDDEVSHYTDPSEGIFKQIIIRDNLLRGAVLVGEDLNFDQISLHYAAGVPVPLRRAELLFPGARAGDAIIDGKQIGDDVLICECAGVTAGKIRKAIREGNDNLYKVMAKTRAGTGCGNCKNKIRAILIAEVGELRIDPAENWYAPGIGMERDALSKLIRDNHWRSVSQVLSGIPDAVDDGKTRMSLDFLLGYIWKGDYEIENDSRCANDRFSGNIQKDGSFSVIPDIPGGVTNSTQLRAIADVADSYDALIKITGADRIGLFSIPKQHLPEVWDRLQMHSGHAFTKCFRACKSCVGSTHCRFGLGDSLGLGQRMGQRYRGVTGPGKFKMGVSGCPRNCSEATIKDYGAVAVDDGWEIYIGGNGGARVCVGQKLTRVKTQDEVISLCDRFYEYYRRHARYGERTAHFIERVAFRTVTEALLNSMPQEQQELESSFRETLDRNQDPWENPAGDFRNSEFIATAVETDGFVRIGSAKEIPPGGSRLYNVKSFPVAIFHGRNGNWVASHGICPHEQGPIVDAILGNGRLTCPIHSYSFDTATGRCDNPEIPALPIYPVRIADGSVWVRFGSVKNSMKTDENGMTDK
jgi:nitrite reductase (NADH) large subunit